MSAQTSQPASLSSFLVTLVINVAVAVAEFTVFLFLRRIYKQIYEPRTYLPKDPKERSPPLGQGIFSWFKTLYSTPDIAIYERTGSLDAYVYVRFLKMNVIIFVAMACLAVPILIPVNVANAVPAPGQIAQQGLLTLTIGNVSRSQTSRYAAHLIMLYIFTFGIFYLILTELKKYVVLRQHFLVQPKFVQSAQAKTVLITGISDEYLDEAKLRDLCSVLPGQVVRVWIHRDYKDLPDLWNERNKACGKLEGTENSLAKETVKSKGKYEKKFDKAAKKGKKTGKYPKYPFVNHNGEEEIVPEKGTMIPSEGIPLLGKKKRPSHWQWKKWMPFGIPKLGKKVDSVEYWRGEVVRLNQEIGESRQDLSVYKKANSAFILFDNQLAAQLAGQVLLHHQAFTMTPTFTEVAPEDVVWDNLNMTPYEREIRKAISLAGMIGLCLAWSFITAFVGAISTITGLAATAPWLGWLLSLPGVVQGIISGILPPVLQAVLQILLIMFLRKLSKEEGIPRHSSIELSLMTKYFVFLVLFSFILLTFAAALITTVPKITANPSSAAGILANNLPSASTYFINYIILQGLSGAGGSFMRIAPLIVYYLKIKVLASTPRSVYNVENSMPGVTWGTTWPLTTLLTVIGLVYSIIAPLVTVFAAIAFILYYLVNRYLFLYVYDLPAYSETGGLFFPKAMGHIFTALYIEMVALAGLFFLASDTTGSHTAIPQGALTVVLIVITIGFQLKVSQYFQPLYINMPVSLAHKSFDASKVVLDEVTDRDPSLGPVSGAPGDAKGSSLQPVGPNASHGSHGSTEKNGYVADGSNVKDEFRRDSPVSDQKGSPSVDSHTKSKGGDLDANAFTHPSAYRDQPVIWLAQDPLGVIERDEKEIQAMKIAVDTQGARMDEKGTVTVSMQPPSTDEVRHHLITPDEAWSAGVAGVGFSGV